MQRHLEKSEVVGAEVEASGARLPEVTAKRVGLVREELARLRDPKTSKGVHENRQQQLMRYCDARLRKPQRLTRLSLKEEQVRWENTLKGFDRVLWEAMRAELLEGRMRKPKEFVEGVRDAVVCHCDQIPMWLRFGVCEAAFYGG